MAADNNMLSSDIRGGVGAGLAAAFVPVYLGAVGILAMMNQRMVVAGLATLSQLILVLAVGIAGAYAQRKRQDGSRPSLLSSVVAGAVAGVVIVTFAHLILSVNLRSIFIALTPPLARILTFDQAGSVAGSLLVVAGAAAVGLAGGLLQRAPARMRQLLLPAAVATLVAGLFQEFIQIILQSNAVFRAVGPWLYGWEGLKPLGAAIIFFVTVGITLLVAAFGRTRAGAAGADAASTRSRHAVGMAVLLAALLLIPVLGGPFIAQIFLLIGLYLLMGMGLNLELGLAGLLDLGFVAFFATGAYATALLTADSPLALANYTPIPSLSFWLAMPIAILVSVAVGVLFGLPVLGVRGDYLAVATLGLGEIVRIIVLSDAAAPVIGGAQGILQVPKPRIGSYELGSAVPLFYLTLLAAAFAAYCAWRLERSRLGRAWIALREDEDVAQAMGVNLVQSKLFAYAFGAAFAGMAGSIFAVMVSSVFPSSFQLLMSINVLALIIVGGLGSLPGIALGAVVLIGLPEALREFGEFRYLFYGLALILTMRLMPDGLWPRAGLRRPALAPSGRTAKAATAGQA
jgi:branched-chain amino acid transport system permease protein